MFSGTRESIRLLYGGWLFECDGAGQPQRMGVLAATDGAWMDELTNRSRY